LDFPSTTEKLSPAQSVSKRAEEHK
jgi:hypothetical protein